MNIGEVEERGGKAKKGCALRKKDGNPKGMERGRGVLQIRPTPYVSREEEANCKTSGSELLRMDKRGCFQGQGGGGGGWAVVCRRMRAGGRGQPTASAFRGREIIEAGI